MSEMVDIKYKNWINELKQKFQTSQIKASIQVNSTLLEFYWNLGNEIIQKQKEYSWGSGFLEQLSCDLNAEFPDTKGFSKRNLELMRRWVSFYNCGTVYSSIAKQLVSQNIEKEILPQFGNKLFLIPWGHNIAIIQKCKTIEEAFFYVENTIKNGISRSVLIHQIELNLYTRSGKAITNFEATLPPLQSDLAKEITKDPYNFDFLTLSEDYKEKELEDALCENITKFLLELGSGFAFVGKQYKLNVADDEFKIDLLFYHIKLKYYVVVELKTVEFKPEFAGKLSFYTSAIDGELKDENDNLTIGLLICKSKNDLVVEYSLKNINKPLGISEYELVNILPKEYKSSLPTIEEIEAEILKEKV
ncbi:PDDEXK nuclease domain-containing protein [Aliarcobacter butzleri]|uniref:PDDEXK nuclease domain-containing protein n=1 Tax=Aliarcobacter butzleri TaxID=28197 RepID=UPI003B215E24